MPACNSAEGGAQTLICADPVTVTLCADLVPREVAEAWLKYLREELPTVGFKCSTQKQAANLGQGRASKAVRGGRSRQKGSVSLAMQGSGSLGAEALLQLLKNYTRNLDIKTAITVGEFPLYLATCMSRSAVCKSAPEQPARP